MEKKQRIIFSLPNDDTFAQTISKILEKNGIADRSRELLNDDFTQKIIILSNTTKDLFEQKTTEEKIVQLFQEKLKISKEGASKILNDIKTELIPFAQKIDVPEDGEQAEIPINATASIINDPPMKTMAPAEEEKIVEEIKEPITPKPIIKNNSGPDAYREPIE